MMQCNACGTLLLPAASSCSKCGKPVYASSDYDAIPYIDAKEYPGQASPAPQLAASSTIQQPLLPAEPEKYPRQQRSRSIPVWMTALIIVLSLLLIVEGVGSAIYAIGYHSTDLHAQATTVAQNFLTAQAKSTVQISARATATANAMTPEQIYQQATSGTPVIDDSLKDNSGNVWYHYGDIKDDICTFRDGAYHVQGMAKESPQGISICIGYGTMFQNLAFQAQIKIAKGFIAGLMFRVTTESTNNGYLCLISTNGYYAFNASDSHQAKILANAASTAIITGQNQPNLVTIIARDHNIYLYINGQFVKSVTDATYASGQIAFIASTTTGSFDAAFNNVKVWKL